MLHRVSHANGAVETVELTGVNLDGEHVGRNPRWGKGFPVLSRFRP